MIRSLVSIHDVMPSSMQNVGDLIQICRAHSIRTITLLVVPGLDWSSNQLDQLRKWEAEGCELAGHGWTHHCKHIRGWWHRLHSLFLSRDVAEHLSLTPEQELQLVSDCAGWFSDHGFRVPQLYVPPAWAFGKLPRQRFAETPFQIFESLSGVFWPHRGVHQSLPLVGFEADSRLRQLSLRTFNQVSAARARRSDAPPLRISIHPDDHRLRLSDDLAIALSNAGTPISYRQLVGPANP